MAVFKEQSQSLIKKAADKLKIFREKVFKKWSKVTDYLKQKSTDTWENVGQMFEQLDKEIAELKKDITNLEKEITLLEKEIAKLG